MRNIIEDRVAGCRNCLLSRNKVYLMGLRLDSATCSKSNINIFGTEPTNRNGISRFDRVCDTYHFEFGLHVTVRG